ncbi:hypothetical protein HUS23_13020 [Ectothiorhodospiraceae bacterium 2226]|nr:hypothetical protein HUS23_13020 [Ectothiorhodospiraceae bacterium 2226]
MSWLTPHERLLGMVLGPILWAVHFLFVYIFQAVGCSLGLHRHDVLGLNLVDAVLLAGSAVLMALVVAGAVRSLLAWRRYRPSAGHEALDAAEGAAGQRRAFMARVAFTLFLLSLLAMIWVTVPIVLLPDPCLA